VGVDAASTYCFLLSQESNRDGVTWGVRLLELQDRGLAPDAFLADFGSGLRAGCSGAFAGTPCWGDVFHGLQPAVAVVSALEQQAYAALAARDQLARPPPRPRHPQRGREARRGKAPGGAGQRGGGCGGDLGRRVARGGLGLGGPRRGRPPRLV